MQYGSAELRIKETKDKTKRAGMDISFLALVVILLAIGVTMVLSASFARAYFDPGGVTKGKATYYFIRQFIFAALGVAAMIICSRLPVGFYKRFSMPVLIAAVILLMLVPIIGTNANGAKRWIGLGAFTIQPSEIAKIGIILAFASMICARRGRMKSFRYGILPFAAILAAIVGLLVLEPHFSASIIIVAIGGVMLFLGGARLVWFIAAAVAAGGGIAVLLTMFPYASTRITTWRDPFASTSDEGYQIVQSLYSIGSGGLTGLGLGQSRQKYLYLPEEHNDFIFSVVCEELGFIGALLILTLFALLIIRGYWIALHSTDRYSFLVAAGITTLLAIQVILNVAVVTNLVPCTGISLPFFSYGGTALLMQMAEMGIVLSISRDLPAGRVGG
ncbi:cell cycle protein [Firmicutes bacterium CAG:240]|jgi:cell division protein FtsW|nr:putative lipid II flippase FtsW [Oscillospiraceae bacterium]CDB43743.1 cell cycle protein [Firmicutes bacterium CAG:240]